MGVGYECGCGCGWSVGCECGCEWGVNVSECKEMEDITHNHTRTSISASTTFLFVSLK